MSLDEQSISLNIELPQEEKKKRQFVIDTFESMRSVAGNQFRFYMVVSSIYLKKLMNKKQQPSIGEKQRKILGNNCLICDSFKIDWFRNRGCQQQKQEIKGNINFTFQQYIALTIHIYLGPDFISEDDYVWAKMQFYSQKEKQWRTKSYTLRKEHSSSYSFSINEEEIEQFYKPNFIFEICLIKQPDHNAERQFLGIRNEGNTCYMNSILQILYFIRPLRKIIIQSANNNGIIKVLKQIFLELMTVGESSSVQAEELIRAYARFDDYPRQQQDIHEFIIGFFEELEADCPQIKQLWQGRGSYVTSSRDEGKPYTSTQKDQFSELQLHMEDPRGTMLTTIKDSLQILLQEQKVDDKIDTDQYGKIKVVKQRYFESLPNVIFLNVKRYEFHREKKRLRKLLSSLQYPPTINLGFMISTPGGEDYEYTLFALTVHKGSTPNSGHYYSLVNTSQSLSAPSWHKFNDSIVQFSSEEEVLGFSGQKKKVVQFSKDHNKFVQIEVESEETAYLLVYLRKSIFQEYQRTKTSIPKEYISKKLAKKQEREKIETMDVQIHVFKEADESFDPFDNVDTFSVPLNREVDIGIELKKIERDYLGCQIGSIWKVNKDTKRIKQLFRLHEKTLTPNRIFDFKRGHAIPHYLLVVPIGRLGTCPAENYRQEKLGLVKIINQTLMTDLNNFGVSYEVINKTNFGKYIEHLQQMNDKKCSIQNKEQFQYDWNDYCVIVIQN